MLKPIYNKLILELEKSESKTKSGIIVSNITKEKEQIGKIISINEKTQNEQKDLNIGKRIIFDKYLGTEVTYNEKEYIVLDIKDILAIIEE